MDDLGDPSPADFHTENGEGQPDGDGNPNEMIKLAGELNQQRKDTGHKQKDEYHHVTAHLHHHAENISLHIKNVHSATASNVLPVTITRTLRSSC